MDPINRDFISKTKQLIELPNGDSWFGHTYRGRPFGHGEFRLENGTLYRGPVAKDKPNGQGELKYVNDTIYRGPVEDGKANGYGKLKFPNGVEYSGNVKDDKKHGKGTITYNDGSTYEGNFENDKRHGHGELKNAANETIYKGNYYEDFFHGKGKLTFEDGSTYEGNFENGKRQGHGELKNVANETIYDGDFHKDIFHGKGKFTFESGSTYEGNFEEGKKHGYGKLKNAANETIYDGDFYEDFFHGKGKLFTKNEMIYEGTFSNGKIYNPTNIKEKKDQTILLICQEKYKKDSALEPLSEYYKNVIFFNEKSEMDNALINKLISDPTKKNKDRKKIKIVVNEHGYANGEMADKEILMNALKNTLEEIRSYNIKNQREIKKRVTNIDITLNVCYGSKILYEDQELKEIFKNVIKAGIAVNISTVDEKSKASVIMLNNNKNSMPTTKTEGYYIINVFRFNTTSDLKDIKPYKIKKYKTADYFLNDKYEGKNSLFTIFNDVLGQGQFMGIFPKSSKKSEADIIRRENHRRAREKSKKKHNLNELTNINNAHLKKDPKEKEQKNSQTPKIRRPSLK